MLLLTHIENAVQLYKGPLERSKQPSKKPASSRSHRIQIPVVSRSYLSTVDPSGSLPWLNPPPMYPVAPSHPPIMCAYPPPTTPHPTRVCYRGSLFVPIPRVVPRHLVVRSSPDDAAPKIASPDQVRDMINEIMSENEQIDYISALDQAYGTVFS